MVVDVSMCTSTSSSLSSPMYSNCMLIDICNGGGLFTFGY